MARPILTGSLVDLEERGGFLIRHNRERFGWSVGNPHQDVTPLGPGPLSLAIQAVRYSYNVRLRVKTPAASYPLHIRDAPG